MQNIDKIAVNFQNQFVYGMGSFFNVLNSEHKKCFNIAEINNYYFHSSIGYPGSSFFYKRVSNHKKQNDKRLILKIAGYSCDQLKYEIDESIKEFKLDKLYGFQLWEKLPIIENKLNLKELTKIVYFLEELKKNRVIQKTFFQLEPQSFNLDEIDFFDGYAFYGYPYEFQLDKNHYEMILKKKKLFLQFQFFGGRSSKIFREEFKNKNNFNQSNSDIDRSWIEECYSFTNNIFKNNCFYVGCTQKSKRLEHLNLLINEKKINYNLEFEKKLQFSDNLKYLTKVDYPVKKHPDFLKKIRSNFFLLKLYIKKLISRLT